MKKLKTGKIWRGVLRFNDTSHLSKKLQKSVASLGRICLKCCFFVHPLFDFVDSFGYFLNEITSAVKACLCDLLFCARFDLVLEFASSFALEVKCCHEFLGFDLEVFEEVFFIHVHEVENFGFCCFVVL